ncbi:MAG: ABC transporter ATP-binding protein [Nitrososphaerota archaeon]|nr:ABC transporter ATP-binding protein [Nitrososphaerota archaeon]
MEAPSLVVNVREVTKDYVLKSGVVKALKGINLQVKRGEYISIMGPSGSGKTTLFNMIGGLDRPTSGSVLIDGMDLAKMNDRQLAWVRSRKIGYIFQTFNLIPVLSAQDNVALPMVFLGIKKEERLKRAAELLEIVGLGDRLTHRPHELSGGQQQRVAIARALANNPSIILADEPTGNLDLATGLSIVQILYRLKVERNTTVICATHDLKMVDVSDKLAWLRDGVIERMEERTTVTLSAGELEL